MAVGSRLMAPVCRACLYAWQLRCCPSCFFKKWDRAQAKDNQCGKYIKLHYIIYIHTYVHIHTDIHTDIQAYIQTYRHTDKQTYIHTYIQHALHHVVYYTVNRLKKCDNMNHKPQYKPFASSLPCGPETLPVAPHPTKQ